MLQVHTSFAPLAEQYDAFLVDLWGVIHDGLALYPGVLSCLAALKQHNKQIIFLSNAPRRAVMVKKQLTALGVPSEHYDDVISSGEGCYRLFEKGLLQPRMGIKSNRFLYVGPDKDRTLLDGLDYEETTDVKEAGMVIATGFDHDESTLEEKLPILKQARLQQLPLLCANPDKVIVRQSGSRALCAGILGEAYEAMAGKVVYIGKPHEEVYQLALELLGKGKRVAAIGDSMETDMQGAYRMGIDAWLVTGGIHGAALGCEHGEVPEAARLEALCESYGVTITGGLARFGW